MPSTEEAADPRRVWLVLGLAVLGISSSAVLVRGMEALPLAIAAWRTLGAALVLSPTLRRGLPGLGGRDALAIGLAGALLGLHFWAWFASVQATTVLRATVLVCLTPVWSALLEWALDGTRPRATYGLGLLVALPGVLLLGGADERQATVGGDGLALLAGVLWSMYMRVGREVRQRVDTGPYMALACASAAAVLFPLAVASGAPLTGFPATTWGLVGLAVLLPQLVGHQGFAYALKWVPASTVAAVTLLEPVGATLLAAAVLAEVPGPAAIAGAALVLGGIALATRRG